MIALAHEIILQVLTLVYACHSCVEKRQAWVKALTVNSLQNQPHLVSYCIV